MKLARKFLCVAAAALALNACAAGERLTTSPQPRPVVAPRSTAPLSARDAYARELELNDAAAGRSWEDAGRRALRSGLRVAPSFREQVRFPANTPHAIAYRFPLREGQALRIRLDPLGAGADSRLHAELFQALGGAVFRPVETLPGDAAEISFRARSTGEFVLRLQPEIAGGAWEVLVEGDGGLQFPVADAGLHNVIGVFGDARGGGSRSHEGIDIVAPRGTPVVAVTAGRVLQARNTPVGGLIIWLMDGASELTYYYAHLDDYYVREGQWVSAGDTIGSVGDTGNARGTTPHLHFGIYRPGTVALDPAPLLEASAYALPVAVDPAMLGRWVRPTADRVRLRSSPHLAGAIITELNAATPLFVLGGIGEWHRVVLTDGTTGFIAARLTVAEAYGGMQ